MRQCIIFRGGGSGRIRSWAGKALSALMVTAAAYTYPVVAAASTCMTPLRSMASAASDYAQPLFEAASEVFIGENVGPPGRYGNGADFCEVFAGCANLTQEMAAAGFNVPEPRDIKYGHDLLRADEQERMLEDLEKYRPKLLWLALPCTMWCPWQRINYYGRRQELRRLRKKQKKLVRFAVRAAMLHLALGGEVVFEHPRGSDMWDDPAFHLVRTDERFYDIYLDMCQFGLCSRSNKMPHKKPTTLMATHPAFGDVLRKSCCGDHEHAPTAGSDTRKTGEYTTKFCKAVVKGFQTMLRTSHEAYAVSVPQEQETSTMTSMRTSGMS